MKEKSIRKKLINKHVEQCGNLDCMYLWYNELIKEINKYRLEKVYVKQKKRYKYASTKKKEVCCIINRIKNTK